MEEFITAKPTITPLVAGATTTLITGTLVSQFNFPGGVTSIIVSLILALLVAVESGVSLVYRVIYYFLNTITIFSVAMGINAAGIAATQKTQTYVERQVPSESKKKDDFFSPWF